MNTTRVHSDPWIFDGAEYHRAAVDRSESEDGTHFHPRVDVRHVESQDHQQTYKLAPGAEDPGLRTLKEARAEAERGRAEWEGGKRTLYPMQPEPAIWPHPRDMLKDERKRAAIRPRNEALEKHGAAIEAEVAERLWPQARDQEPGTNDHRRDREPDADIDR